jgi:single-stranded DNA-binding protein
MNTCILMAEIIQEPQLRHTPEGMELAEMMVQFPGTRPDDPPSVLRVVGWGNLAKEIHQNHHQGDHVLLEGRLNMNTIDRPEGFKEKRAELTVQRVHSLGVVTTTTNAPSPSIPVASSQKPPFSYEQPFPAATPAKTPVSATHEEEPISSTPPSRNYERSTYPAPKNDQPDVDDIPF